MRRDGARAQTVALAGTTRRSADPAVDDHLGEGLLRSVKDREEQAIVARRIERTLEPVSVWVTAADEPMLVKVQNVQHLATPIRAQLADPLPAVELAGMLLPTPAVGGEPREAALPLIPALEGLDRGWYAGAVGWTDLGEDGEFCVALRCALLRGQRGAPVRGLRDRARLGARAGARRERGQARGAAAAGVLRAPARDAPPQMVPTPGRGRAWARFSTPARRNAAHPGGQRRRASFTFPAMQKTPHAVQRHGVGTVVLVRGSGAAAPRRGAKTLHNPPRGAPAAAIRAPCDPQPHATSWVRAPSGELCTRPRRARRAYASRAASRSITWRWRSTFERRSVRTTVASGASAARSTELGVATCSS